MKAIYAAFDLFPSPKGAATHIGKVLEAMSYSFETVTFYSLGFPENTYKYSFPKNVHHVTFNEQIPNYLKRAERFTTWIRSEIADQHNISFAQFRDIYCGLPVLDFPHIKTVFEVNGLPSVELPYRYKNLGDGILNKFKSLEKKCLSSCDKIITPSETIKTNLKKLVADDKIRVITNGADDPIFEDLPFGLPEKYGVYFGALQPWQGLDVILKAYRYLEDLKDLHLVICSSSTKNKSKHFQSLIQHLGIGNRVHWYYELQKPRLNAIVKNARFSLAPLKECSRNLDQGCSPLKVFESMANQTPIIASDIPSISEILVNNIDARLVHADRPALFARAIRFFHDNPHFADKLAINSYKKYKKKYTWDEIKCQLTSIYENYHVI